MKTKWCNRCEIEKPEADFHKDKTVRSGLYGFCKVCKTNASKQWQKDNPTRKRETQLKRNYGISLEDYQEMKKAQNNCCATCDRNESELKRSLMVDHCHTSGKIRGLLCDECNLSLGKIKDNIQTLEKMILYLKINPGK